jgi:hypothetical protein
MLFATGKHTRRLLLPGDEIHQGRTGKIFPETDEVPEEYLSLLEWARDRYAGGVPTACGGGSGGSGRVVSALENVETETPRKHLQVLLDLRLAGAHLANGEDPDDYVRRLREGWE